MSAMVEKVSVIRPTSMMGVPVQVPCRMIPESCSPIVPIAVRIRVTRSVPGGGTPCVVPTSEWGTMKPRCRLASRPETSQSTELAPGSRISRRHGSNPTGCVGCGRIASPKLSPVTSLPSLTISNATGRSSWQRSDLASPNSNLRTRPTLSGPANSQVGAVYHSWRTDLIVIEKLLL